MGKYEWIKRLTSDMQALGLYKPGYDNTIETLASILEMRDAAEIEFCESGGEFVIDKFSDRGAKNKTINPLVTFISDLNEKALAYFNDLGMTPVSRMKLLENSDNIGSLAEALKVLDEQKP